MTLLKKADSTLRLSSVKATRSPRTSFKKILLKERSIIRESSIDFAMNCPMTLKMCVRLLGKCVSISHSAGRRQTYRPLSLPLSSVDIGAGNSPRG